MLNRTGLNKEFGYKEPVQRKKKYFNSQWFRYLSLCQLVFHLPSFQTHLVVLIDGCYL